MPRASVKKTAPAGTKEIIMNWEIAYTNNFEGDVSAGMDYKTPSDLKHSGLSLISAKVPGNFESELVNLGIENDYLFGTNILSLEKYKNTHVYYFTEFFAYDYSSIVIEKLFAKAVIYLNGEKVKETDHILSEITISDGIVEGQNTLVIHIIPSENPRATESRELGIETKGIGGEVYVKRTRKCEIRNAYVRTSSYDKDNDVAKIRFTADIYVRPDSRHEFSHLKFKAVIKDEKRDFSSEGDIFGDKIDCTVEITHPKLWYPKNSGRSYLYDSSLTVLDGGKTLDVFDTSTGIRTLRLSRSGQKTDDFELYMNDSKVFLCGASIVPSEIFKQEDSEKVEHLVQLASEMNCNVLRYKGDYAPESFYDACDKNGIAVITALPGADRDFAGRPENQNALSEEALIEISRIRNHPSAVLFTYDEKDCDIVSSVFENRIGQLAKDIPFIPGEFHKNSDRDASDFGSFFSGVTGCPSVPSYVSLKKFIHKKESWPVIDESGVMTGSYIAHFAPGLRTTAPGEDFLSTAVKNIFGEEPVKPERFTKQNQIAQAECIKTFIEYYRANSDKSGGVIAFSLNDAHTLISEAVIDYYLEKKIACSFIKRSLTPLCLLISGSNGVYALHAVNYLPYGDQITYVVKDLTQNGELTKTGVEDIFAFSNNRLTEITLTPGHFYQITWTTRAGREYTNHFFMRDETNDFDAYMDALTKAKYNEFKRVED